ncbi:MAG: putative rane protein [Herbinix sp.]|nr:putative rane protein [Herbinix sp.]
MSSSAITINQIMIIFIIIAVGIICYKVKLIDEATNSKLSNILLMLVNPMVIFVAYQREFSSELLEGLLISLLLSIVTHVVGILIASLLIKKKKRENLRIDNVVIKKYVVNPDAEVERIQCIYSNVGFMGIPIVNGIFGTEGVFYVTASITIFNVFLWTHGVIMMSGSREWNIKSMLKKLLSPSIIAIVIGLLCFLFQLMVPKVIYQAFSYIANINTPFAMLIAGVTIGRTNIFKILVKRRIYYVTLIKLIIIPMLLLFIFSRFAIDEKVFITAVIMAAAPSATTGILFAIKYEKDSVLAAEILTVTTLLCAFSIPLLVKLAGLV